jgi:hypothetical protein
VQLLEEISMYQTHSPPGSSVGQPYCSSPAHRSLIAAEFYDADKRREMIAQAAYFRAKRRGFAPGHELEDWLIAKSEVDAELTIGVPQ